MTLDQCNSFLIEEFEHLMSEINCPDEYIMDLFISDIMREDYVITKILYRRRKTFLLIYRGLLFLLERRFEIFFNVTFFTEIIRNVGMNNLSKAVVVCLIRAGMVFAITEIWKAFIEKDIYAETLQHQWKKQNRKIQRKQKLPKLKL